MSTGFTLMINAILSAFNDNQDKDIFHLLSFKNRDRAYRPWTTPALLASVFPNLNLLLPDRIVLAYSLAVLLAVAIILLYNLTVRKHSGQESYAPIHALTKLIIPTRSLWPQNYFASRSWSNAPTRTASIPVTHLLQDIVQGKIELRQPVHSLPLLMKGQLCLDGWNFGLRFAAKLRMEVLLWSFSELFFCENDALRGLTLCEGAHILYNIRAIPFQVSDSRILDIISPAERSILLNFCLTHCSEIPAGLTIDSHYRSRITDWIKLSQGGNMPDTKTDEGAHIWPYLDFIPHRQTESILLYLKRKASSGPRGQSVLSLTTCETPVSIFSKSYMLTALLYMREPRTKNRARRTLTPLHTRLHQILGLLASGKDSLNILLTQNASMEYAQELNDYAKRLEYDLEERKAYIKAYGVEAWREERLYARWEAALFNAGLLTRWVILVDAGIKDRRN